MKTAKYNFKQSELYTIARFVLALVTESLPRFTAFKGKYTALWVADRLTDVDKAEDLADEEQRDEEHSTKHVALKVFRLQALNKFNALERYIAEVFPAEVREIKIDAAGGSYYTAAAGGDFDATAQLLTKGSTFIQDNLTVLLDSGNNMPAIFQTDFDTLKTNFKNKHTAFLSAEADAQNGTEDKLDANNALYEIISNINADAQVIFTQPTDESERDQFTVEHQLQLVRGAGVAGMRFHVTDSATTLDIVAANILIKPGTQLTTNVNGRVLKLQLAAATYQVVISKPGYITQELSIIVETGTVKRVNIQLQPA